MSRLAGALAIAVALLAAGALRLPGLGQRPMHTDEAVHADKLNTLWQTGAYVYDPHEYHGPTLYYLTLPILAACGVNSYGDMQSWMLRLAPALAGMSLTPLLWLLRRELGAAGLATAAALTACSPALVFYSRYYIQETPLIVFSLAALVAVWRLCGATASCRPVVGMAPRLAGLAVLWRLCGATGRAALGWALLGGAALGLMHATKETCVLAWAALAAALWAAGAKLPPWKLVGLALLAGALVSAVCVSNGFRNPRGALDSLLTYFTYFERAGEPGVHVHPWTFYWQRLLAWRYARGPWFSEAIVLAAAGVGVWAAWRGPDPVRRLARLAATYSLLLAAAYTLLPYKTPWCALGFWHGLILLAGCGIQAAMNTLTARGRVALGLVLAAGVGHLAWQAWRLNHDPQLIAHARNPYVYAHPTRDVERMAQRTHDLVRAAPNPAEAVVYVIAKDPWPLPWYLRDLRVGYWETPPDAPSAPIVAASAELQEAVAARLATGYVTEMRGVRPDHVMVLNVAPDLWARYLAQRTGSGPAPGASP